MNPEPDITEVLRHCATERNHVGNITVAADLLTNAADEIERLRSLQSTACTIVKGTAADEIERLRKVISEWIDAENAYEDCTDVTGDDYRAARLALRKAVGR